MLTPSKAEDAALAVAAVPGLCGAAKPLMLMGTAAADLAALDAAAAVDHRVAGFEEEARRLRRRQRSHVSRPSAASGPVSFGPASAAKTGGPPSMAAHPYTFASYKPLPVPEFIKPPASAALRLAGMLLRTIS